MLINKYYKSLDNNYILILSSNSKEKEAIDKLLGKKKRFVLYPDQFFIDVGVVGGVFFAHLNGESGIISDRSVVNKYKAFVSASDNPKPALVILAGICWGNPSKVRLNDTILCNHVITANQREISETDNTIKARHFYSVINGIPPLQFESTNIHIGTLISAETLLKSESARDEYLSCDKEILGGEMEAFALIPFLANVNWLVIKTVSDYGSGLTHDRESQAAHCSKLTEDINKLLPIFIGDLGLQFEVSSPEALVLHDIITGDRLDFHISSFDLREINDHLNDKYGPVLLRKINNYIDGEVFKRDFGYKMAALLLEIVQNSFRHNNSTLVSIVFNIKSISIETDNEVFNVQNITGERGGAIAWNKIKGEYVDDGKITVSVSSKKITFSFGKFLDKINEIKSKCCVDVVLGQSGYSRYNPTLKFNEDCDSVYIDMTDIIMPSRAISIFDGVKDIISQGRVVYIKTRDDYQRLEYMEFVGEGSENIKIIY